MDRKPNAAFVGVPSGAFIVAGTAGDARIAVDYGDFLWHNTSFDRFRLLVPRTLAA